MAVPRVLEKMTAPIDERAGPGLVVAMVSSSPDQSDQVYYMYYTVMREIVTNGVKRAVFAYRWFTT